MLRYCLAPVLHSDAAFVLEPKPAKSQFASYCLFVNRLEKAGTELPVHGKTSANDFSDGSLSRRIKGWVEPFVALVTFVVHSFLNAR
jgi:hypothetical protein